VRGEIKEDRIIQIQLIIPLDQPSARRWDTKMKEHSWEILWGEMMCC